MTNKHRLEKLKQAESLIREVEFSYPQGHPIRQDLYRLVVNTFSFIGPMPNIMKSVEQEQKELDDKEVEEAISSLKSQMNQEPEPEHDKEPQ